MNGLTGTRWVRAIYLDTEVRTDWQHWREQQTALYNQQLRDERDATKFRWLQGKLQAFEELTAFIESIMDAHRKAENEQRS
jgi:hypothetical protein